MTNETIEYKSFNLRMKKELWMFLKKTAASHEMNMSEILLSCLEKYKRKLENKLTQLNIDV